jgi:hypothetical protein
MQKTREFASLHLSPSDIKFCEDLLAQQLGARESVGAIACGATEVRTNQMTADGRIARVPDRINKTDNLVGHIGALAGFKYLFREKARSLYKKSRDAQDERPTEGDLSDVPGYRIDIKTSLVRNRNLRSQSPHLDRALADYHLAVPPKERNKLANERIRLGGQGFVYIQIFLVDACDAQGKNFYAPNGCTAKIVGWLPEKSLPQETVSFRAFNHKHVALAGDLHPMESFCLNHWRDRLSIGAKARGLGGALSPLRHSEKQYPVEWDRQIYPDAWTAYVQSRRREQDLNTMTRILSARFEQYPNVLKAVGDRGGMDWLADGEFYSFGSDPELPRWYGRGVESLFIRAIVSAYDVATSF